ncbi:MAG: hypothetical protein WCI59_13800 [Betaproteobacteria bacterium]
MPFPTVNAVLQMAYAEARKVASKPLAERDSPAMRLAVEDLWAMVKDHLPASDAKVRRLDELITQITSSRHPDGQA